MTKRIGKLHRNLFLSILLAGTVAFSSGCPTAAVKNGTGSNNALPYTRSPTVVEQTPTPGSSGPDAESFSLATPSDAYRAAYAARQSRDIASLKRVLSQEILEFFTEMGKVQNRSLDEMLLELAEKPQASTAEVRDEKISGDRALLQYKDEKGEWKEMDFVREDGGWKLTLPKAEPAGNRH